MAKQTDRLRLAKAESTDLIKTVLIDLFNQNWEVVDTLARDADLAAHTIDVQVHVAKDGSLQDGLNAEMLGGLRAGDLAPAEHHHYDEHYTKAEADSRYALKEEVYILGDDRYALADEVYARQEADGLFARQADVYLKAEADGLFASLDDVYTRAEADGRFAAQDEVYTKSEADLAFAAKDQVYTKTDADDRFAAKDQVYTTEQANSIFAAKDTVYTKLESDNRFVSAEEYLAHRHAGSLVVKFNSLDFYWEMDTAVGETAPQWADADTAYSGLTQTAEGASIRCLAAQELADASIYLLFSLAGTERTGSVILYYLWAGENDHCRVELDLSTPALKVWQRADGEDTLLYQTTELSPLAARTGTRQNELALAPAFGPAYGLGVSLAAGVVTVYFKQVNTAGFTFVSGDTVHSYTDTYSAGRTGFGLSGAEMVTLHRFCVDVPESL